MNVWRCSLLLLIPAAGAGADELINTYSVPDTYGNNTFVGNNAGNPSIWGRDDPPYYSSRNTSAGTNTLANLQKGWENTALGVNALWANLDGYHNTALGFVALASSDYGAYNTAIGYSSMYRNLAGAYNTAAGLQSLYRNIYGSFNVAIGRDANFSNTFGSWNTGVGVDAIPGGEAADGNTSLGGESGYTENLAHQNVSGVNNTWIGYQSGPSSWDQHDGVIGIGYRAKTSKDWQAVLGSVDTVETLLYGNVGINATDPSAMLTVMGDAVNMTGVWDVYSDERLKQDVQPYEDGLAAVMTLQPVSFRYNGVEGLSTDETHIGLIAQDVETVAPYMISTHAGEALQDVRRMSPQALPYMLANALRELAAELARLEQHLAQLEAQRAAAAR